MNIRDNATIRAPSGKDDVCAVFTIDTTDEPFVLQDIAEVGQEYTLSFYARSESSGGISVADKSMAVGVGWKRYVVTFVADDVDLPIYFTATGTYYLYNTQLEIGNKDTDFALNPADTEQSLDDLTVVVNNHSTQFSIMDGQISALIAEDATIRGEYDALVSRTTAIEANLDGITSRVTLTEADISGVDRRLTEAESTIVQQAGEIALTVKEQDVTGNYIVGKLNLSSTTAKIAAKNIDLSGYVTVSSLKTAGATTIDGSNITTGLISADRIDAESLMTKKLTATNLTVTGDSKFSGVLDGATGSFSGAVTAKALTAYDNVKVYDSTSGKTHTAISAFYTSETSGVMLGSDSSEVRCASRFWAYGIIESSKWISADSGFIVGRTSYNDGYAELYAATPYIDFHFNNSSADYTSRIIELSSGVLTVTGGLSVGGDFYCTNWGSGTNVRRPVASAGDDGTRVFYISSRQNSSGIYYLTVNGQYGTDGNTYNSHNINCTTSDARLKTNVSDTNTVALPVINQIQIRQFDWKENGIHQKIGFVADELEAIDSNLAFGGGYNEDGSMDVKSVNEFYLVGYLTKGIQELHAAQIEQSDILLTLESRQDSQQLIIDMQADKIAVLEKRIKELEKQIA